MSDKLEPLDPALRELLDLAEGAPPPPPSGAMERVLDQVPSASTTGASGSTAASSALLSPVVIGAVAVVLAAAVAWYVSLPEVDPGEIATTKVPTVEVEVVPVEVPPVQVAPAEVAPVEVITPPVEPANPTPAARERRKPEPKPSTLDAERALLDDARRALTVRDADAAAAILGRYDASFPEGALAEERAAFAVWRLSLVDQASAKRAAAKFRARFPASLHLGLVDAVAR